MTSNQERLEALNEQLKQIKIRHNQFFTEITEIQAKIKVLEQSINNETKVVPESKPEKEKLIAAEQNISSIVQPIAPKKEMPAPKIKEAKPKIDLESFIGENLISKIGILITVIGVAIGGKYAIDNDLISPLTRIILGYVLGLGLIGIALKLKEKYNSFSAVLLSGAMAIFYFITYFAYGLYGLIPQEMAFVLMLLFTVFTVFAAIHYKKQVIAIFGLVGAYAIPFILSNDSGNVLVLFSYIAILNIGIMITAFKQYWKPLYIISFAFTWIIYLVWCFDGYSQEEHFMLALIFATIFFMIFYATFLSYKLIRKEEFNYGDIILLMLNSFIFYGLGYGILSDHETGKHLLGIFTVFNAIIHFIVGTIIYKKSKEKEGLFYTVFGLVLVFLTIAVPVQLDGNWVTLFWIGEAALLYWIGITKNIKMYKRMAYPLLAIAVISLFQDWDWAYDQYSTEHLMPIFNIQFLTSILFVGALTFINYIYHKFSEKKTNLLSITFGVLLLIVTYYTFSLEISNYINRLDYEFSKSIAVSETDFYYYPRYYNDYKFIWLFNYTLLFFSIVSFLNIKKWKMRVPGNVNSIVNTIIMLIFLSGGLYTLSELRQDYLYNQDADFVVSSNAILLRYVSFAFLGLLIYTTYLYSKQEYTHQLLKKNFKLFLVFIILWILSSELLHWLDIAGVQSQYKLSLSILWGSYALLMVGLGIWKRNKAIRVSGIVIFSITLVKLFFYDIAHLSTISKTIVFIALGILLLIISFLYNKYTSIISNNDEDQKTI